MCGILDANTKEVTDMKKIFAVVLALALLTCGFALAESAPVTITDGAGREVTITAAERLISLTPANTAMPS